MNWKKLKVETGKRYGRLTVTGRVPELGSSHGGAYWMCRCDCGCDKVVRGNTLRLGKARDCGKLCPLRKKENHGKE